MYYIATGDPSCLLLWEFLQYCPGSVLPISTTFLTFISQLLQKDLDIHRSNMEALKNVRKRRRSKGNISWDTSRKMSLVYKKWQDLLQKSQDRHHKLVETKKIHSVSS